MRSSELNMRFVFAAVVLVVMPGPVLAQAENPDHPAGYRLMYCYSKGCVGSEQPMEYRSRAYCELVAAVATMNYQRDARDYPEQPADLRSVCIERDPALGPPRFARDD
jgi:hypothetical protein